MNQLDVNNCNKTHCNSCLFHPEENKRIKLEEYRIIDIKDYLASFRSSHICHVTNKTCYGAMEYQANILFSMGLIEANTVESFLKTAKEILGL